MLKTVSAITNAIGALNYKGTWNASTNTPALVSGAGTKGYYYVVSAIGTTTLDGISTWGVGDWAAFNGSVWQRVEGGADLNGVNVSFTGTTSGPTFETNNAAAGVTVSGNSMVADGTDANIDINITPKGTGDVNLPKVDIDSGAIDNTIIGGSVPAAATVTSLTSVADNNISISGLHVRTKALTVVGQSAATAVFTVALGNFSQRVLKLAVVSKLSSGAAGSRSFYRESLIRETGDSLLAENNITNIQGANGTLAFSLSGSTITVTMFSNAPALTNESCEITLEVLSRSPGTITTL
jgi:hypothetical protein